MDIVNIEFIMLKLTIFELIYEPIIKNILYILNIIKFAKITNKIPNRYIIILILYELLLYRLWF